MKGKIKKTLKGTAGWIVYLVFLVGLVWGTPKALSYFLETPYPIASITSGSMWPTLKKGDLVLIKGVSSKDEISIGDIVVYENVKGFTIHRVVSLGQKTVITKGDANNASDSPVGYEDIVGKALTFRGRIIRIPSLGAISILIRKDKI